MRHEIRAVAAAIMIAFGVGSAGAQTGTPAGAASDQLTLTQAQETTILLRVENDTPQSASGLEVGGTAPEGLTLKGLPSDVGAQIPEAERFHYAKLQDRVVLVDPTSKRVVKVIRPQAATTGGGGSLLGNAPMSGTAGGSR
jgi:hypothetical protein